MTRIHFNYAASLVRTFEGGIVLKRIIADHFILLFKAFNPAFNEGRFLKACELVTTPIVRASK